MIEAQQRQIDPESLSRMNLAKVSPLQDIFVNCMRGKVALVSGGASGLGYMVVNRLCDGYEPKADGSEMVIFDLFGFIPPQAMSQHAKSYANLLGSCIQGAATFNQDVKSGVYPPADNGWSMDEKELDKFMNLLEQKY